MGAATSKCKQVQSCKEKNEPHNGNKNICSSEKPICKQHITMHITNCYFKQQKVVKQENTSTTLTMVLTIHYNLSLKKIEYDGAEPDRCTMFEITYTRSDGKPVDKESEKAICYRVSNNYSTYSVYNMYKKMCVYVCVIIMMVALCRWI